MAFRLAVVCLALILTACGGSGGGGTSSTPQAQWGRSRGDVNNSGNSLTGVTNTAGGLNQLQLNGGPIHTTPAVGVDGSVFVATERGGIYALEPLLPSESSADIDWQFNPTPTLKCTSGCALALDGFNNSFFGTDDGFVFSLDDKGALLWQSCTNPLNPGPVDPTVTPPPSCGGAAVIGSPVLVIDTVLNQVQALFVGTADGRVLGMGGQDGQIRWTYKTNGGVRTSLAFNNFTIYAPSDGGVLYSLTQAGTAAFPPAGLGVVDADFTAAPSVFGQVLAQSGLAGSTGGRVRGFSASGTSPIWDRELPAPVRTSLAQYTRPMNQRLYGADGTVSTAVLNVTDYFAVDDSGASWLIDPQLGTLGTRCIGGIDDLQPCRDRGDCRQAPVTPGATPLPTPNPTPACLPPAVCNGGDNAGISCRTDTASTDCPGAQCVQATTCQGGTNANTPCNGDEDCPGGTCNLFSVDTLVQASPVTTAAGTIFVVATTEGVGSTVFAIEPPNSNEPLTPSCSVPTGQTKPDYCRFAVQAGIVRAAPAVALDGTVYFGDEDGFLYAILTTAS